MDSRSQQHKPMRDWTLIELYLDLDKIHWRYKFFAAVANWMMLAGFTIFPSAFDDDKSKIRLSSDALRGTAVVLLAVGYITTGLLCWHFKNILFQAESIFVPGFASSTVGMVSSLFNVYGKISSKPWSTSAILAVALSAVFMLLYGTTALNANRSVAKIRQRDQRNLEDLESKDWISSDEVIRRRLLELLCKKDTGRVVVGRVTTMPGEGVVDGSGVIMSGELDVTQFHLRTPERSLQRESVFGLPPELTRQTWKDEGVEFSATVGRGNERVGDSWMTFRPSE